jgi:hypothetical protein
MPVVLRENRSLRSYYVAIAFRISSNTDTDTRSLHRISCGLYMAVCSDSTNKTLGNIVVRLTLHVRTANSS